MFDAGNETGDASVFKRTPDLTIENMDDEFIHVPAQSFGLDGRKSLRILVRPIEKTVRFSVEVNGRVEYFDGIEAAIFAYNLAL